MVKKVRIFDGVPVSYKVYKKNEHHIDAKSIDTDALTALKKIRSLGYECYIVGGAVRDLILGKKPKDFDLATSMTPSNIRKNFHNARIIGKRFKLVLLMFKDNKQIEVATFRSSVSEDYEKQKFGTIAEDAFRRDFGVNSLYYDPIENIVLDFTGGFEDIKSGNIVSVIRLDKTFIEDPVRMIRAIKYSIKDKLKIESKLSQQIASDAHLIAEVSSSRMAEEILKIIHSGMSYDIFVELNNYGLLKYILPTQSDMLNNEDNMLISDLKYLDCIVKSTTLKKDKLTSIGIYLMLKSLYFDRVYEINKENYGSSIDDIMSDVKNDFCNLNFPNYVYRDSTKYLVSAKKNKKLIFDEQD